MKKLIVLLCLTMLSGCSWMKFWEGDDAEAKPAELVKFEEEIRVRKLWSRGTGSGMDNVYRTLRPALANGAIYAADIKGRVTAVDADSGKELWQTDLEKDLSGGVGTGGGLVLVADLDGRLFALDAATGQQRWRRKLNTEILSAPGANGEVVVVQTLDAKVYGLDAASGQTLWQYNTDTPNLTLRGGSAPLVTDTTVIAGFSNGKIIALDVDNGNQLWENRVAVPQGRTELERMVDVEGSPLLVGDMVYATSYQGRVAAMSRGTGRGLWYQDLSSFRSPGYGDNQVLVTSDSDEVKALRASSGQVLWTNDQLTYRRLTGPVAVDNLVAVADSEGYVHVLAGSDGRMVGRVRVDGSGVTAPMISDGSTLYVMDNDGDVTAYRFEPR